MGRRRRHAPWVLENIQHLGGETNPQPLSVAGTDFRFQCLDAPSQPLGWGQRLDRSRPRIQQVDAATHSS